VSLFHAQAVAEREVAFKDRLRAAPPATRAAAAASTFSNWGAQQQQQQQPFAGFSFNMPINGSSSSMSMSSSSDDSSALSHTGATAPLSTVGALLAADTRRQPLAAIAQAVAYTRCAALPLLALQLQLHFSTTLPPDRLLRAVLGGGQPAGAGYRSPATSPVQSPPTAEQLAALYAQRLTQGAAAELLKPGSTPAVSSGTKPDSDSDSYDLDFKTVDPHMIGLPAAAVRGEVAGDAAAEATNSSSSTAEAVRAAEVSHQLEAAVRSAILALLLEGVQESRRSLTHLLLGLDGVLAAREAGLQPPQLPPPPHSTRSSSSSSSSSSSDRPAVTTCLQAVLQLAASPGLLVREPCLAEQCLQLVYRLCSNSATSAPVLALLDSKGVNFFPLQLRAALAELPAAPAAANNLQSVAQLHALAWALRGAALDLHVALNSPRPGAARRLLAALLGPAAGFDSSNSSRPALLVALELAAADDPGPHGGLPAEVLEAVRAAAVPVPGPPDVALRFNCIDVPRMLALLSTRYTGAAAAATGTATAGASSVTAAAGDQDTVRRQLLADAARWAIHYNAYAARLCARHHLSMGWRYALEVAVQSPLGLAFLQNDAAAASAGAAANGSSSSFAGSDGSSAAAGRRRVCTLLQSVLKQLASAGRSEPLPPVLAEHLSHTCVTLVSCLGQLDSSSSSSSGAYANGDAEYYDSSSAGVLSVLSPGEGQPLLVQLLDVICAYKGSPGGTTDATARTVRSHLYACVLRYLHQTQQALFTCEESSGSSGGDSSSVSEQQRAALAEEAAAVRGEHRLQNMSLLDAALDRGLVSVLGRDACSNNPTIVVSLRV
jgi:Nuclear pore complex scaffold, nucleoporins 186/192/205